MSRAVQWFALVQFALLLTGVGAFLWQADTAPLAHNAIWFAVLLVGQWALGAVMQGRIGMLMALMLQSAALATATSALGFTEWHWLFKPLTMFFALVLVAASAYSTGASSHFHHKKAYPSDHSASIFEVFTTCAQLARSAFTLSPSCAGVW